MISHRPSVPAEDAKQVDLADPRVHAERDLSGVWQRLRAETPVSRVHSVTLGCDFWAVTRYADAVRVYRDSNCFSSRYGNVLDVLSVGPDSAGGRMMAVSDGTQHSELRTVLLRAFSPRALDLVVRSMRVVTLQLIEAVAKRRECDFATEVAALIPLTAVCDLLRVPVADRNYILSLTSSALASTKGTPTGAETWTSKTEILAYFADLVRFRRNNPDNDIISLMVTHDQDGRQLSDEVIVLNCYSLVMAGDETTRLAMIGGILALIENSDQWSALKNGHTSIDTAVEEILRWTTPTLHGARTAMQDVEIESQTIRRGDIVAVWNVSADADERQFQDPDTFDLARHPNRHLAFAYGPHFCVGAYLARAELAAMLITLRGLCAAIELAGPTRRIYSNFLHGYCSLPISVQPDIRWRWQVQDRHRGAANR
jgi:cytochrome P450